MVLLQFFSILGACQHATCCNYNLHGVPSIIAGWEINGWFQSFVDLSSSGLAGCHRDLATGGTAASQEVIELVSWLLTEV